MTDAFQCDRCDEFFAGSGEKTRYGTYKDRHIGSDYNIERGAELCDDCKAGLDELVNEYLDGDVDE